MAKSSNVCEANVVGQLLEGAGCNAGTFTAFTEADFRTDGEFLDLTQQLAQAMEARLGSLSEDELLTLLHELTEFEFDLGVTIDMSAVTAGDVQALVGEIDFTVVFEAVVREAFEGFAAEDAGAADEDVPLPEDAEILAALIDGAEAPPPELGAEAEVVEIDLAAITADEETFGDDEFAFAELDLPEDLSVLDFDALMNIPVSRSVAQEEALRADVGAFSLEALMSVPVAGGFGQTPQSENAEGDDGQTPTAVSGGGSRFAELDGDPLDGTGSGLGNGNAYGQGNGIGNGNAGITAANTAFVEPVAGTEAAPPPPAADPGYNLIYGDAGDNVLNGTNNADEIWGLGGNDNIDGKSDGDILYGGDGNDTLDGGQGADTLYGDAGNDTLDGGQGDDILYGGLGSDTLDGGQGDDILVWDVLDASIDGSQGNDTLRVDAGDADLGAFLLGGGVLSDLEQVDLGSDAGANTLTLSAQDVLDMTDNGDAMTILGDGADNVEAGIGWIDGGSAGGFHTYTQVIGPDTATLIIDDDILVNANIV